MISCYTISFSIQSHWQSRENPNDDMDPDHWDHALLLTGLDLFAVGRDGFTTHQIVGKYEFHSNHSSVVVFLFFKLNSDGREVLFF